MFEKDYDLVQEAFHNIGSKHSFEKEVNPYKNQATIQRKCKHMWPNDTDAIYFISNGKMKCAICGKVF